MSLLPLAVALCLALGASPICARPPALFRPPPFFEPISEAPPPVEPTLADAVARFPWAPRPAGVSLERVIEMLPHARPDVPFDDQEHTVEFHCTRLCLDDDIDFACNGTTLPCSPCISECLAQTPRQDFRLQSMVQQEFLVSTRFAWNPPAEAELRGCYLTWETQGGGYVGHMMADSGKAELGLWPNTKYTVRLQCKATNFSRLFPQNRIYVDTSKAVSMKPDPEQRPDAEIAHRLALEAARRAAGPHIEAAKPRYRSPLQTVDFWTLVWVATVLMCLCMASKILQMRLDRRTKKPFPLTPELQAAEQSGRSYCFVLCCGRMLRLWPCTKVAAEAEAAAASEQPIVVTAVQPEVVALR